MIFLDLTHMTLFHGEHYSTQICTCQSSQMAVTGNMSKPNVITESMSMWFGDQIIGDWLLEICSNKNPKHMTLTLECNDVKKQEGPLGDFIKAVRALRR